MQIKNAAKYIFDTMPRTIKQKIIIVSPANKIVFLPAESIINL